MRRSGPNFSETSPFQNQAILAAAAKDGKAPNEDASPGFRFIESLPHCGIGSHSQEGKFLAQGSPLVPKTCNQKPSPCKLLGGPNSGALLLIGAVEDFPLRYQPVFMFMARLGSSLHV
jgi:hypothetical protein